MRKIWDIHGGIHPPENKHQSLHESIGQLPLPDKLIIPLNQHIGAPAKALVEPGEHVLKGQLIAEAAGFISAGIHAPTSGTIAEICDHQVPHPSGMTTTCIILKPDGEERWTALEGIADYRTRSHADLLDCVKRAGITGMGGAGFPTSVKLGPVHPIDTLIINGTECEPYITADDVLMQERAAEIVAGVKIISHILSNPETVLIGVEDNKPKAFEHLQAAANGTGIQIVAFPTKYPSGGEKQLIQILTGKEVPSGKLPADLGMVVHNVGTAYAVHKAVTKGEPLISRITTVTGKACKTNRNYEVLIGTPVRHLLECNGFDDSACTRLVMGGPMMGFTLPATDVPIIKTTNCILACSAEESPSKPTVQQPCIRCGMCAEVCPASLLPQQLYWYSQSQDVEKAQAYNLADCIECGACAYVCPSSIPLVQYYRATKGEIRKQNAEKTKSDHARERFEFHQARIEKAEAEKTAKREARRLAALEAQKTAREVAVESPETSKLDKPAKASGSADELIKAAMARAEAKKASPEHQKAKLERGLEAAKNRMKFAQEKFDNAVNEQLPDDQQEKLRATLEEAKLKLVDAEKKLAGFTPQQTTQTAATNAETAAQKVAAKLQASPREQLETKIFGLKQRIATTEEKIAESDDETVKAALVKGLEKQQDKLADAEQQLGELGSEGNKPIEDAQEMDAAAAAIARAQAKAKAMAEMTPDQKLDANITALKTRVEKAQAKLQTARDENSEHIDTLATALAKLEEKLLAAQQEKLQTSTTQEEKH